MSEFKAILQERKVEKPQFIVKKEDLDFSSEIFENENPEINEFLIKKTIEATTIQVKSSLALGKIFTEVFEKLSGNNRYDGLYERWIEISGYNKRTALRHRNRFELYGKVKEDKRSLIGILPIRIIEEIYNHDDLDTYISLINEGISKEELSKKLIKIVEEPKVIEYEEDELELGIIEKTHIFQKLNSENLKKLDDNKKKKIDTYLKKIESLLNQ